MDYAVVSRPCVVASYDLRRGDILYRVFLLDNTLQIDLSFWPATELRATGPKFSLIFGAAGDTIPSPIPDSKDLIGMAWLYALHVRSSIARSRFLQAEHMFELGAFLYEFSPVLAARSAYGPCRSVPLPP